MQLFDLDEQFPFVGDRRQEGTDHAFSREILSEYYDQATKTLEEMNAALWVLSLRPYTFRNLLSLTTAQICSSIRESQDLPQLFSLSLFLEGPSASLGAKRVRDLCQTLRQYSCPSDKLLAQGISRPQALRTIDTLLQVLRLDLNETAHCMEYHYRQTDRTR